ncbi:MAG: 50S ribosomal protein L19 [Patescibacteria group bacterium]
MQTTIEKKLMKKNVPDIVSGDTIRVHLKVKEGAKERVQIFEGLVIAVKHGKGLDGTFTVRKESFGIGVERVFPLHSPRIIKIERIKHSKVRRAKLYFMRELTGKNARLKEQSREYKMWEEKEAEEELAKIEAEKAKQAEADAAKKAEKDAELAKKAESALAARSGKADGEAEEVEAGSNTDERAAEPTEEKADEAEDEETKAE